VYAKVHVVVAIATQPRFVSCPSAAKCEPYMYVVNISMKTDAKETLW
jgi:hypothetical protein